MKLEKTKEWKLPTGVLGLAAAPDESCLYAACMDGQVYVVDTATGSSFALAGKHTSYASGCRLLPGGKILLSSGYDGVLIWHDLESRQEIRRVQAHDFWSWQLALSPAGDRVASVTGQYLAGGEKYEPAASNEPTVKLWDTESGQLVRAWEQLPPVLSVTFSPDGRHLAAANLMGEIRIWNLASGELAAKFLASDFTSWGIIKSPHYCGGIYSLAFAPDGQSVIACGMGNMTDPMAGNGKMLWQRWSWQDTPKLLGQIHDGEQGAGLMETLAHVPDGSAFLMAGRQAQGTWNAAVFSSADGKLLASLDTKSRITRGLFNADGKTLFLAAALGQPKREKNGEWPDYGRIHVVQVGV